jgi:hypothetical protein
MGEAFSQHAISILERSLAVKKLKSWAVVVLFSQDAPFMIYTLDVEQLLQ